MTETAGESTVTDTATVTETTTTTDAPDAAAEAAKWQALARKHEARARENAAAAKRLAEIEEQNKTDLERAVEAARNEGREQGRTEAAGPLVQRLASAEFIAAAARRNATFDASAVLDDLNLAKYIGEDGEVDTTGIAAAVERLVPAPDGKTRPAGNADQGARTTAPLFDESPRGLIAAGLAESTK